MTAETNRELVGRTVEVMVEGISKLTAKQNAYPKSNVTLGAGFAPSRTPTGSDPWASQTTQLIGRTRGDQIVVFDGPPIAQGPR